MAWSTNKAHSRHNTSDQSTVSQRDITTRFHALRAQPVAQRLTILGIIMLAFGFIGLGVSLTHASEQAHTLSNDETSSPAVYTDAFGISVQSAVNAAGQAGSDAKVQGQSSQTDSDGSVNLQANITQDSADVSLNGQTVPMSPQGGSVSKTVESANGKTVVDISIKNNGGSSNSSNVEISNSSSIKINTSNGSAADDRYDIDARHGR